MADNKYLNGKIYAIRSKKNDKLYIGSTYRRLDVRFTEHKRSFLCYTQGDINMSSFVMLAYGDAYIELIENYPCSSKTELRRREGEHMLKEKTNAVNKNIAGRTKSESNKAYKSDNQNSVKAQSYKKNVCECGGKFTNAHKAPHKKSKRHQEFLLSLTSTEP